MTLDDITSMIQRGEPFALSRWGDGEWSAILGHGHHNCDGQEYTPQLRQGLAAVLEDQPQYLLGMQALARRRFGDEIDAWLEGRELAFDWIDSGIFHTGSIRGLLAPLMDALSVRGVLMVGPARLGLLALHLTDHVIVPDVDAYDDVVGVLTGEVIRVAATIGPGPVIAISAGMGANVMVHRLAAELPEHTAIDFGSVWEPYVGVGNRRYHQTILDRLAE
jgi:hypothetical protein